MQNPFPSFLALFGIPRIGTGPNSGTSRDGAATAILQRSTSIAAGASYTSPLLRVTGLSRLSVSIIQKSGVNTGSWQLYAIQGVADQVAPIAGRKYGPAQLIGAIGDSDPVEYHVVARLVYVIIEGDPNNVSTWDINLHASGSS